MKNSSNDMYIDGSYLKNNPDWAVEDSPWKADIIYELLTKNGVFVKKVIDVGCGAGGVLRQLAAKSAVFETLVGYDISPQAISLAGLVGDQRIVFKNESFPAEDNHHSDLLLVIDVLEHVDNFYEFLRSIRHHSEYFIFHIPLDLCCRTLLKPHVLLQQRQAVGHIHYFSKEMVDWFLKDTGYQVIDWLYTKPVIDRTRVDSFRKNIKKTLRNLSFKIRMNLAVKLWGGYSILVLAKKIV